MPNGVVRCVQVFSLSFSNAMMERPAKSIRAPIALDFLPHIFEALMSFRPSFRFVNDEA